MEKSIRLSTKRLILREFQAADWKAVLEWDADPDVVRYLTWDSEHTGEAAREHVRQQIMQSTQQPRLEYSFVIALPDTEQPIGSIDLHLRDDQLSAWVAYRLHPAYRRQGYATEALRRVLQFSFESLHLHRVKATANRENIASCKVLTKSGMRYEGCERAWDWQDEAIAEDQYALLDREWGRQAIEPAFSPKRPLASSVPHPPKPPINHAEVQGGGPRTSHLYLRAFTGADWVLFHTAPFHPITVSLGHPLTRNDVLDEREARDYVAGTIRKSTEYPCTTVAYVMARSNDDQGIGVVTLTNPPDSRVGWLDVHLHPDVLQSRDAPDALQALLDWEFVQHDIHRIAADCWAHDLIASHILEQAGMNQEACYVEAIQRDGIWQSLSAYAAYAAE